jgi:hypothetical protein
MQVSGISPRDGRFIEARESGAHRNAGSPEAGIAVRDAAPGSTKAVRQEAS